MSFKFIDLFAGISGMRLAAESIGGTCVFSSEINPHAQKTYEANFGENPFGDITTIAASDIPDHDVLFAGFPCQPVSLAGKRRGFEDARGTLFFDVARIAREKKPYALVLENVKNLVGHDSGNTFRVIRNTLENLGYTVSWSVLNANRWLPQSRERTIIIASLGGRVDLRHFMERPLNRPMHEYLDRNYANFDYLNESEYTLISEDVVKTSVNGLIFSGYRNKALRGAGVREGTEHLSRAHKQHNRIYSAFGLHQTISAQETSGRYFILIGNRVRKVAISELYRFQGFPDDFKKPCSRVEQLRQVGNSVPIPMIRDVASATLSGVFDTSANLSLAA